MILSQAHLGARHYHPPRGYDPDCAHERAPQSRFSSALTVFLSTTCRSSFARPRWRCVSFPCSRLARRRQHRYHNEINIGIAVALENGLIVPVVRGADEKNVLGLQRAIVDLATRARLAAAPARRGSGRPLSPSQFRQLRNLVGTPIINQPRWPLWEWARWIRPPWWWTTPSPSAPSATVAEHRSTG